MKVYSRVVHAICLCGAWGLFCALVQNVWLKKTKCPQGWMGTNRFCVISEDVLVVLLMVQWLVSVRKVSCIFTNMFRYFFMG